MQNLIKMHYYFRTIVLLHDSIETIEYLRSMNQVCMQAKLESLCTPSVQTSETVKSVSSVAVCLL